MAESTKTKTLRQTLHLDEPEIRQAIAHYLSRQGSLEFDAKDVFLNAGARSHRGVSQCAFTAEAIALPKDPTS